MSNTLDGKTWMRYSVSIWSDLRKTAEEMKYKHPASFPISLASRLIEIFTSATDQVVLDPFAGIGSTVVAAQLLGRRGIGIELSPAFAKIAQERCTQQVLFGHQGSGVIHVGNAFDTSSLVEKESIDLVVTSPPYWNILEQKRTADGKDIRDYGDTPTDLGKIDGYTDFLTSLKRVFTEIFTTLRSGAYCCAIVMDIRKKQHFFPFHSDLASVMQDIGFLYDDMIIWDRRHEYSNLRPLGYPSVFRVNKTHEFILIFQKV